MASRGMASRAPVYDDLSDKIMLSVRTKGFESSVEVPIPTSQPALDAFVLSWLAMMQQALKMHPVSDVGKPPA